MYPNLLQPFANWANANIETFSRFARSPELLELTRNNIDNFWRVAQENVTRFTQSGVFADWTKANVENFSRFAQEYSRSVLAVASETQGEISRNVREGTRRLQQVASIAGNLVSTSAEEAGKAVRDTAEEVSEETDEQRARARRR